MKIAVSSFAWSGLLLCLCGARVMAQGANGPSAQSPSTATALFAIPQDVDPSRLTYTSFGTLYTNTDGRSPGDNGGTAITGGLLSNFGGGGLELHGQVGNPTNGTTTPVTEVDFYTTYTGTLNLTSTAGNSGFAPWQFSVIRPLQGYAQGFSYFKTNASQADLDVHAFFALLTITPNNPNDAAFASSSFGFGAAQHPQDVPEPGTLALLGGLGVPLALLWRRRRAARPAQPRS